MEQKNMLQFYLLIHRKHLNICSMTANLFEFRFNKNIAKFLFSICQTVSSVTFTEEILNGKLQFLCSELYSFLGKIILAVPQGSLLSSQSISFDLCHLFLKLYDYECASYSDKDKAFVIGECIGALLDQKKVACLIFKWFQNNHKKGDAGRCYRLVSID